MTLENKTSAKPTAKASGQVQSLARGLSILTTLAESGRGMTLSQLCDEVKLASSTAHRLLSSLEQQGFVAQDQQRGKWSIGVQAFSVGNGYLKNRDVATISRPFMRELMEVTGETSNLGILDSHASVLIAQVECKETMRMVAPLGGRTPAHASGIGKALLSQQTEQQIHTTLEHVDLAKLTDKTITDISRFIEHLQQIKQQGYSVDDEEQSTGLRCIAANIYNEYAEPIAAVSISGPKVRLTDNRLKELGLLLISVAEKITKAMGGQSPASFQ